MWALSNHNMTAICHFCTLIRYWVYPCSIRILVGITCKCTICRISECVFYTAVSLRFIGSRVKWCVIGKSRPFCNRKLYFRPKIIFVIGIRINFQDAFTVFIRSGYEVIYIANAAWQWYIMLHFRPVITEIHVIMVIISIIYPLFFSITYIFNYPRTIRVFCTVVDTCQ